MWAGEVRSDEEAPGEGGAEATSNRYILYGLWLIVVCETWSCSEGVESAVVEVLRVLGRETAAQAITQLVQTYSCLADLAQSQGICSLWGVRCT